MSVVTITPNDVGRHFITKDGRKVKITDFFESMPCPVRVDDSTNYSINGCFWAMNHKYDFSHWADSNSIISPEDKP